MHGVINERLKNITVIWKAVALQKLTQEIACFEGDIHMKRDKKFIILFIVEIVLPWLVLAFGIPAIYYCHKGYQYYSGGITIEEHHYAAVMLYVFHSLSMGTGLVVILTELIIGFASFIWMIVNISQKKKERFCIIKPLVLWLCPVLFTIGTFFLMIVVSIFTYGQSV